MKRLYPEQPLVGVGAIIICEGKILLERRQNNLDEENGVFQAAWWSLARA